MHICMRMNGWIRMKMLASISNQLKLDVKNNMCVQLVKCVHIHKVSLLLVREKMNFFPLIDY